MKTEERIILKKNVRVILMHLLFKKIEIFYIGFQVHFLKSARLQFNKMFLRGGHSFKF